MNQMFRILSYSLFIVAVFLQTSCAKNGGDTPSGGTTSSTPTVSVRANQTINGYPHKIDYYIPSNATAAVVFLHGGGGKKEGLENDLGIKNDSTTTNYTVSNSGQSWLLNEKIISVFPQGQTLDTYNAWTWNNFVMISGQDDVAFLQALVASLKADSTLPPINKIYLVGHSNGGMMANRMWCQSPTTFDGYGSLAGPPSSHFALVGGDQACTPSTVQPYIGIVGDSDRVLRSLGNMSAASWSITPVLTTSSATWVDANPTVLNEKLFHSRRVNLKCGGTPAAPVTSGQLTTYSDCSNSVKLIVISQTTISGQASGGDHCLATPVATCTTTLSGATGLDYKTTLVDFLKAF
ncbi:MAG: alpha/beta hydrolase family esterase [Bacillota bacterium]